MGTARPWGTPGDGKPFPWLQTEFNEAEGHFSPDARWIAYVSDESGRNEIYAQPFVPPGSPGSPEAGGKWLDSKDGGAHPRWRNDGKELYYSAPDGTIMAVNVMVTPEFRTGAVTVESYRLTSDWHEDMKCSAISAVIA